MRGAVAVSCLAAFLAACDGGGSPRSERDGDSGAAVPTGIRFLSSEPEPDGERDTAAGTRPSDSGSEAAPDDGPGEIPVDEFARATTPRAFRFPADHAGHPEYRTEWWYFTGNVTGESGRHYGFELTFFRYALAPSSPERESAWSTRQIFMAHLAVTDTSAGELIAEERMTRGALGLAGAEADPLEIWIESWSISGGRDGGIGTFEIAAEGERIGLRLAVEARKPAVAHGEGGVDAKGPEPGNASYYYSLTRMAASGTITVDARSEPVEGLAWMDREWSTSALSPSIEGWDWFALQLSDGRDLMLYRLRGNDGSTSPFSGGSLVDADGDRTALGADDFRLEAAEFWESRASGVRYPVAWRIELPSAGLELEVRPVIDDQEILLSVRYWEGAVRVAGRAGGGPVSGSGYVELAGYH